MTRTTLSVLLCLFAAQAAWAKPGFEAEWATAYPNSQTDDNVIGATGLACALCHTGLNGNEFNAYGWEIRKGVKGGMPLLEAIKAAEGLDSDADPGKSTNLIEINAGFQPGWTAGNNNILYNKSGTTVANQPAPTGLLMLDPAVVNQAPTAVAGGPYAAAVGAPVAFDGSASKDDGTIVSYAWDFGDGMTGTGPKPTHAYVAAGTYMVTLTVTDDMAATGSAKTSAVIMAGNAIPVAVADAYSTPVNTPLQVAAPGVLENDTDGNMDALTAKMVTAPTYGTLALMADGSFLYTPNANYTGPDSFTYQANDGKADSAAGTVSLMVMPPVVLDLDIGAFRASKRARVGGKKAISLKLIVLGITGDGAAKSATLVGTQNGAEVYKQTIEVAVAAGGRESYSFPTYAPAAGGEITWELTLMDDDTDVDTASASTLAVE